MYTDKSGMFEDFGFKLIVINSLLEENPSFMEDLEEMKDKYVDSYNGEAYTCIAEMIQYFQELILTKEDLDQVTSLYFDGGNEVYFYIMPDWDGESEEFEVESIGDYKLLRNLERVSYTSMCDPSLMDILEDKGIIVE